MAVPFIGSTLLVGKLGRSAARWRRRRRMGLKGRRMVSARRLPKTPTVPWMFMTSIRCGERLISPAGPVTINAPKQLSF